MPRKSCGALPLRFTAGFVGISTFDFSTDTLCREAGFFGDSAALVVFFFMGDFLFTGIY
jgi:hypothetical protein